MEELTIFFILVFWWKLLTDSWMREQNLICQDGVCINECGKTAIAHRVHWGRLISLMSNLLAFEDQHGTKRRNQFTEVRQAMEI